MIVKMWRKHRTIYHQNHVIVLVSAIVSVISSGLCYLAKSYKSPPLLTDGQLSANNLVTFDQHINDQ